MGVLTEKKIWRRKPSVCRTRPSGNRTRKLTPTEQANVRRAVWYLQVRLGSRKALAKAAGMTSEALRKASGTGRQQTMRLAVALAYVAGVRVERMLAGKWARGCPWCGRKSI